MKKYISALLLLVTVQVNAYDFVVKNIYYNIISPNEVAVTRSESEYSGIVRIPEQVTYGNNSYAVTEVEQSAFAVFTKLTEVVLPNTIKKIGDNAFASCFSLKKFNIPNSVEYIGASAFNHCEALDTIRIPENVMHIGQNAFGANTQLKWIEVAHFNRNYMSEEGVLFNSDQTEIVSFPAGKEGHYDIPVTITTISEGVFYNARLTSVKIPYGVMTIDKQAFWYCSELQSVEIPPSVIFIGEQAFSHCRSLKEISIPASVQTIEKEAFLECRSLKNIDIPSSIFVVNERTFAYCTSLEKVNIKSATVRAIDKLAFSFCTSLKELTLPSTVIYVGHGAFYPCKQLSKIRVHHVKPLPLNGYVFSDVDKSKCEVFVPAGSLKEYKEANEWKDFKHFVPTNYQFTVSFSQPKNGTLTLLNDSVAIQSGSEFAQSTELVFSLVCEEGYEFEQFIINGITLDFLPPSFQLMDDTKIEVKLKRSEKPNERVIELAQRN